MSYHLRDIGGYRSTVGYICYRGTEPWGKSKSRPGEISIEKQQGMEVLGVDLSPSMSIKVLPLLVLFDKIERMSIT